MVQRPYGNSSPGIVTSNSDSMTQQMMMQAMMANLKPEQQAPIQAAMQAQARKLANIRYMQDTIRKMAPSLTNGAKSQVYNTATPLTFNLQPALNAYLEGIVIKMTVNYTLAAGTSAVYGLTAAGKLGLLDTIEVRYNKSQMKVRPVALRQLALLGAVDEFSIPENTPGGNYQQDATLQALLDIAMPVATGAQTVTTQFFIPLNWLSPNDPRGLLPLMSGDTGIQVIINTPTAILGTDPLLNALYAVSGSGHAVSAVGGSIEVDEVYRDGDCRYTTDRLPFELTAVEGTAQAQIDVQLNPLVANTVQRTRLNIMGYHYYVILCVIDAVQSNQYALDGNITYIEESKDAVGGNVFQKYGTQTNLNYSDFQFWNRMLGYTDMDQGIVPMVTAPLKHLGEPHNRTGKGYLDNTHNGWTDWRYGIQVGATGTKGAGPRIEPWVFYINPQGLMPV